jgi:hypothetical protein
LFSVVKVTTPKPPSVLSASASAAELLAALAALAATLEASTARFLNATDQNLGHIETQVLHDTQNLQRETVQRVTQAKADASVVLEQLSGVKMPPATLDREAKPQGQRAQHLRAQLDEQAATDPRQLELTLEPYQMIIQLDAWSLRERDAWGQSAPLRSQGTEPERWHWIYTGTVFRLDHRGQTVGGRPVITERRDGGQRDRLHLKEHQDRMDYRAGRRAGEPIGSGAVEATCRQAQCRFKRPGQFWSCAGDEALLCLETFWRNGRWSLLFPHTAFDPAIN